MRCRRTGSTAACPYRPLEPIPLLHVAPPAPLSSAADFLAFFRVVLFVVVEYVSLLFIDATAGSAAEPIPDGGLVAALVFAEPAPVSIAPPLPFDRIELPGDESPGPEGSAVLVPAAVVPRVVPL